MRIADLIRGFLDIIDAEQPKIDITINKTDDDRRFDQVKDLIPDDDCGCGSVANAPKEQYADIEAVTTDAGGGMHSPKEPEDIRGEHGSLFRDYLAKVQSKNN
jgi:hypothetical protein